MSRNESRPKPSVLVLGAGYAGLLFTARLAGKVSARRAEITLVNESDTFTERLRLHQFATNQTIPWRSIPQTLRGTNVRFVQGRVAEIVPGRREVVVVGEDGQTQRLGYDYLVCALGSLINRASAPGVEEFAYTLAPRGPLSAAALRERLPEIAARGGRVAVCGGGATGIETAAELAKAYPRLDVRLVTRGAFGAFLGLGIARYMRRSLERLGVEIAEQTAIAAVRPDSIITAEGEAIPCDICVWTGGFVASPLARAAGLRVNDRGQILVDHFMRSLSHPEIFAVGDAAQRPVGPLAPIRMSAFTATILGAHGADSLAAILRGRAPRPLSFAYLGQGIALGRGNAIGFNNYPDDRPRRPYFTGRLGFSTREWFVDYLATSAERERRWPGFFFWLGTGRSAAAERRAQRQARAEARKAPAAGRA